MLCSIDKAKKIVVPIDFSNFSKIALEEAMRHASNPSNIYVITINRPPSPVFLEPKSSDELVKPTLDKLDEFLGDPKYAEINRDVRYKYGNPGEAINNYAIEISADLIVIGSHGRSGLTEITLGSVAERIVRHAPCPVIVLRGEKFYSQCSA